jgi:hypothetical protein
MTIYQLQRSSEPPNSEDEQHISWTCGSTNKENSSSITKADVLKLPRSEGNVQFHKDYKAELNDADKVRWRSSRVQDL